MTSLTNTFSSSSDDDELPSQVYRLPNNDDLVPWDSQAQLMTAVENENLPGIQSLIDIYVDVNGTTGDWDRTALMGAASFGHSNIIQLLINTGADVDMQDRMGQTALMNAAANYYLDPIKVLMNSGADLELTDNNGQTALMIAVMNGNFSIVESLINRGADVNFPNMDGYTPFMIAANNDDRDILQLLMDNDASTYIEKRIYVGSP